MKKFLAIILILSCIFCNVLSQPVKLTAVYDFNNSAVKLNWDMINSNIKTSYLLLRSADGVTWTEAAKDRMLRKYSADDIYFFNDRSFLSGRNYYRLKIADANNNTVALSPVVMVNTRGTLRPTTSAPIQKKETVSNTTSVPVKKEPGNYQYKNNNTWVIYPNPVTDILKLAYKGSGDLKGVVNVQVQDATGKVVIKFRSGSMYKLIQIPVSNLQRGAYYIQLTVLDEIMMSQKFIKQ